MMRSFWSVPGLLLGLLVSYVSVHYWDEFSAEETEKAASAFFPAQRVDKEIAPNPDSLEDSRLPLHLKESHLKESARTAEQSDRVPESGVPVSDETVGVGVSDDGWMAGLEEGLGVSDYEHSMSSDPVSSLKAEESKKVEATGGPPGGGSPGAGRSPTTGNPMATQQMPSSGVRAPGAEHGYGQTRTVASAQGSGQSLTEREGEDRRTDEVRRVRDAERIQSQQLERKAHFIGDKSLKDFSEAPLDRSEWRLLGEGAFGKVYGATIDGKEVVIKVARGDGENEEKGKLDMAAELAASEALRTAVEEQIHRAFEQEREAIRAMLSPEGQEVNPEEGRDPGQVIDFAKFQGFGGVVTVVGKGPDGSIIQERIRGQNLQAILENPPEDSPYGASGGFPKNLLWAEQKALEFGAEMLAIHSAGKVHCDIKANNLMLDQNGYLHIIDLGSMNSIRNPMGAFYHNGPPEVTQPSPSQRRLDAVVARMENLQQAIDRAAGLPPSSNPLIASRRAEMKLQRERQLAELQREKEDLLPQVEAERVKVAPSYDIYTEGSVLLGLLFGRRGLEMSRERFYDNSTRYLADVEGMDYEARTNYFRAAFTELNESLRAATGQAYSPEEIQKMSELMAWMMDPEPEHRPTSEQVFAHLMELNGIATAEEEHIRKGQAARVQQAQRPTAPAEPGGVETGEQQRRAEAQARAQAKLEEARQKMRADAELSAAHPNERYLPPRS
ncbi:MAG: hypothetical protein LBF21_00545 [Puniceicoccales bacterium]|jgi:serine/threonine protein kinase|nr:hypothetical protein [Puniceicoccales bacterium]